MNKTIRVCAFALMFALIVSLAACGSASPSPSPTPTPSPTPSATPSEPSESPSTDPSSDEPSTDPSEDDPSADPSASEHVPPAAGTLDFLYNEDGSISYGSSPGAWMASDTVVYWDVYFDTGFYEEDGEDFYGFGDNFEKAYHVHDENGSWLYDNNFVGAEAIADHSIADRVTAWKFGGPGGLTDFTTVNALEGVGACQARFSDHKVNESIRFIFDIRINNAAGAGIEVEDDGFSYKLKSPIYIEIYELPNPKNLSWRPVRIKWDPETSLTTIDAYLDGDA